MPGSLVGDVLSFDERLRMYSSGSLARRLEGNRLNHVPPRLLAVVHAPTLDADLARGLCPSATPAHQHRANHLCRPRVRRRIAYALEGAVKAASRPPCREPARAPLNRDAIRRAQSDVLRLATLVATLEKPRTQGIAMASQLAFDGGSALFFQPHSVNAVERLTNTVDAAHRALSVSGDFDGY